MKNFIITTIISTILFSKTFRILDENQNPISNAHIFRNGYVTISDSDGFFFINDKCLDYTISHIAFQDQALNPCQYNFEEIVLNKSSLPDQEIIINGDLNESKLKNSVSDIEILTKKYLENSNTNHLQDFLQSSTNINYSGVSSRTRYFQIRGIGEYEQFVGQGGPNYYVGTLIDNFNFSGFGLPITMFDVEQVEIFKGCQSFTFGQNSMAGQIKIKTSNPKPYQEAGLSIELGNFNKKNIHLIYNQPITKNFSYRITSSKNTDDGFIYNDYLNEHSNKRDELVTNLKLLWNNSYKNNTFVSILINTLYFDLNNNYDRWSPSNFDNFNNFTSYSDFSGLPDDKSLDALKGKSYSFEVDYTTKLFNINSVFSIHDINLTHNYDGDWSNPNHWGSYYFPFSQSEKRKRKSKSFENKFSASYKNNDITLGIFTKHLEEFDSADGFIFDLLNYTYVSNFTSDYKIEYLSYYLQNTYKINNESSIILNVRRDNYKNTYESKSTVSDYYYNTSTSNNPVYELDESILSARIGLKLSKYHISISRGHKAGGFNQNPFISDANRTYKPEYSSSIDIGYLNTFGPLRLNLNLFHIQRENLHVNIAEQADTDNPLSFYFFTSNIKNGYNEGIDLKMNLKINKSSSIFINAGMLNAMRNSFTYASGVDNDNNTIYKTIPEREQARAPRYTFNIGLESYLTSQLFLRVEAVSKDKYYYFDNENQVSDGYTILNLNSIYRFNDKLSIGFNVRNLLDEKYSVHGFYFSLDGYMPTQLYESPGDPTTYGIELDYKF